MIQSHLLTRNYDMFGVLSITKGLHFIADDRQLSHARLVGSEALGLKLNTGCVTFGAHVEINGLVYLMIYNYRLFCFQCC